MSRRGSLRPPGPWAPRGPLAGTSPASSPTTNPGAWERLLRSRADAMRGLGGQGADPRLPVPAVGTRTLSAPLQVMVALDESGSLTVTDPNRQSHQAVLELCDWLTCYSGDTRDRIGVVRFADRASATAPVRVKDARTVIEQELLAGANVGGGTRLSPAIEELCRQLKARRERRLAFLVTDGQVAESQEQLRLLFSELQSASEAIHLIALAHDGSWQRHTHHRFTTLPITTTTTLGTLGRAQLSHAIASILMRETGLTTRTWWRR